MNRILIALVAAVLTAGAGAGAAAADPSPPGVPSIQAAGQAAGSVQSASSSATSTQVAPQNTNVSVRVLSPGSNGPVSQTNASNADALAANANATDQTTGQLGSAGVQQGSQVAGNAQGASSSASSTQVKPENTNVDVRVLSPGSNGPVTQSNTSTAGSVAANLNTTDQAVAQGGAGSTGQSAEQAAISQQAAVSDAQSKQIQPENTNVSVRVLSKGDNAAVTQRNDSTAKSVAANLNSTDQDITQGGGHGGTVHQSAGQLAGNAQGAWSSASSTQVKPENTNVDVRVLSPGSNGPVTQSNTSTAGSLAVNANDINQEITQGPVRPDVYLPSAAKSDDGWHDKDGKRDGVVVQAAGQIAVNKQIAAARAESVQIKPSNTNASLGDSKGHDRKDAAGATVDQSNDSTALAGAINVNGLQQTIGQNAADRKKDAVLEPKRHDLPSAAPIEHAVPASGGVRQSNTSAAGSLAVNLNTTDQQLGQQQAAPRSGVGVQAAGQLAASEQTAVSKATSIQYKPENRNGFAPIPHEGRKLPCTAHPCMDGGYSKPPPCRYDGCKSDARAWPPKRSWCECDPCVRDERDWAKGMRWCR
ncbi:MAG: hypothetical protein ICV59_01445 [Thermoleophilia bacterium]|nr:hypothetical protein [Thermoleophilia bacterium]